MITKNQQEIIRSIVAEFEKQNKSASGNTIYAKLQEKLTILEADREEKRQKTIAFNKINMEQLKAFVDEVIEMTDALQLQISVSYTFSDADILRHAVMVISVPQGSKRYKNPSWNFMAQINPYRIDDGSSGRFDIHTAGLQFRATDSLEHMSQSRITEMLVYRISKLVMDYRK